MTSLAADYGQYRGRRALIVLSLLAVAGAGAWFWLKLGVRPPEPVAVPAPAAPAAPVKKIAKAPAAKHKRRAVATTPTQVVRHAPLVAADPPAPEPVAAPPPPPAPAPEPEPAAAVAAEPAPAPEPAAPAFDGNGEEIARIIARSKYAAVQACYERELKRSPNLAGKVTVDLELAAPQTVEAVRVSDDLGSPAFTQCVQGTMQHVRFPALNEDVSVQLPFVLTPRAK